MKTSKVGEDSLTPAAAATTVAISNILSISNKFQTDKIEVKRDFYVFVKIPDFGNSCDTLMAGFLARRADKR